jgi:hypothetical protein
LKGEIRMIRLKVTDVELQKIYDIAEKEDRTILGVLYNEYIVPYFPALEVLNPKNVYANKKLVLKMIELDKKLGREGINNLYLNYGPSVKEIVPMGEGEIIAIL